MPNSVISREDQLIVNAILASRAKTTAARLALLFKAKTGRDLPKHTAKDAARRGGFRKHAHDHDYFVLLSIARDFKPEYDRTAIAEAYLLATGRTIDRSNVGKIIRKHLGAPKIVGSAPWKATNKQRKIIAEMIRTAEPATIEQRERKKEEAKQCRS